MKQIWNLNYTRAFKHRWPVGSWSLELQSSTMAAAFGRFVMRSIATDYWAAVALRNWNPASVDRLGEQYLPKICSPLSRRSLSSSPSEIISACNKVQMIRISLLSRAARPLSQLSASKANSIRPQCVTVAIARLVEFSESESEFGSKLGKWRGHFYFWTLKLLSIHSERILPPYHFLSF